eukprot:CAMPEP_0178462214 /NCGR_PEP_ID=MMETSP0689_2-20121128/49711_1 /TAXON_ID=160604 /ORGANISM="Amphidinium massartii, Strain CS-259" /LENGTH=74 /DNA_ID=CAMNT_0020089077 /DNA_START=642 /DNA_END=862 /DNA_ORIENTATION=-
MKSASATRWDAKDIVHGGQDEDKLCEDIPRAYDIAVGCLGSVDSLPALIKRLVEHIGPADNAMRHVPQRRHLLL